MKKTTKSKINPIHQGLLIVFGFVIVMTLILNFVEKDRIPMMGDFFEKVLPEIPEINILKQVGKKPLDGDRGT